MIVIVQFLKTHASFSKNFGYLINNDTGLVIQILNQLKLYLQKHFQPHITHLHTLLATILCKGNTLLIILHLFFPVSDLPWPNGCHQLNNNSFKVK